MSFKIAFVLVMGAAVLTFSINFHHQDASNPVKLTERK